MKKFTWFDAAALAVWILPIAYFIFIYPSLPSKIPLHFGMDGTPDRYGQRQELFIPQAILSIVPLCIYLLMRYLPQIDPKQPAKYSANTYQKIALGTILFVAAINIVVLYASLTGTLKGGKLLLPLISLFFAFLGNIMYSIKPKYFAGIRTPWTLESEDTWRATHRLASKMWFGGGLLLAILTFLLSNKMATFVFLSGTVVLALVPTIYSFVYFKKHQLKS
jgi:uncharacterized membrane protein